ncbi:SH3 domain-containing protein [Tanacetum coccineum]
MRNTTITLTATEHIARLGHAADFALVPTPHFTLVLYRCSRHLPAYFSFSVLRQTLLNLYQAFVINPYCTHAPQPPQPTTLYHQQQPPPFLLQAGGDVLARDPVSYAQLARSIHELAASSDQKKSQRQLIHHVFPKLAVYNSVDPSLAPSLLMLGQQCEDRTILRYVYYYLARILPDTGAQGLTPGGGIPTPNWDALADIDAVGGVTRADVVPRILDRLSTESLNSEFEFHARRLQALKALTYASDSPEILQKLYEIVLGILDKVADTPDKRKKGIFGAKGGDKESIIRSNLQYGAISALRRLPLDPGNPIFLHRAVQGVSFADPVAVRHSLEIISELATRDPYAVAMALGKLAQPGGALQDVLHLHDVLARVALARLCHSISRAKSLEERPDIKSLFTSLLYQLLLDPSDRVCFEAILCVLGKSDTGDRTEERALGWYRLTREVLKAPEAPSVKDKDKASKTRRPQLLIKLVMRRLESSFRSFSRPVLHAAARVVQEMGKSRAAALSLGLHDIDEGGDVNTFSESNEQEDGKSQFEGLPLIHSMLNGTGNKDTVASLLASLMEVVRTTVACECVYVRAMVIKALIWMQSPQETFAELESMIASELSDPAWSASLLNDILLTLHARFKATPDMAVTLLEIARVFATKVPGKIDADVLQLLWKTCLVGAGPDGKHTALEAVTIVLDLPPPQPGSMAGLTSIDRVFASDPKSALALQRLVQAAVWFLGENANYAASEYAWESATPPGTALMMLDADKMVAAASSRNPTLANALTRLQRCAFIGSWEVRIVAAQALTTMAIRSGEPYRIQIYEFLHALAQGGVQSQFSDMHISNGEDQGASGTGLGSLLSPMLKVLDDMYSAQDDLIKEVRNHDNAQKEWTDEELKKLYEAHERLLDLVSLFCYVPRSKYLPLGPTSAKLIEIYRNRHNITASTGMRDAAVATGISELIYEATKPAPAEPDNLDDDLVNAWATGLADDGLWNNAPAMNRVNEFLAGAGTDAPDVDDENIISRPSMSYDDMWAKTLLETAEVDVLDDDGRSSGSSSPDSVGSVETSISSHFGGMNYPSLFSSKPSTYGSSQPAEKSGTSRNRKPSGGSSSYEGYGSPINEEPPPYSSPVHQRFESFENPLAGQGSSSFDSHEEERSSSGNGQSGSALYDFTAGGDDELNLTAGEEVEIEYEVDGWFYVKKKRPGRDGKMAGLVPVLSLLAKQVWRLITSPTTLAARTLKARYFSRSSFFDAKIGYRPSYIWCSFLSVKDMVDKVRDLLNLEGDGWNHELLSSLFAHDIATKIAAEWEIFMMILWGLWTRRNKRFHGQLNGKEGNVEDVAKFVLSEHHMANQRERNHYITLIRVWLKPEIDLIKVNCDAAWKKESEKAGLGFVARDYNGEVLFLGARLDCYASSPLEAEAKPSIGL